MMILPMASTLPHLKPAVFLKEIDELFDFGGHAYTKRLTSELTVSASNDLLADEFVVFGMASDPEPVHAARNRNAESAVMQTHSDAIHAPTAKSLELKRRVRWVSSKQPEISPRERLDFGGQLLKALPEPSRRGVLQGSFRGPDSTSP